MSKIDIKLIELSNTKRNGIQPGKLILDISGKDVNESVVNTLRRVMLDEIPTYAYSFEGTDISENTSVFDNDQMRLRLSQVPIYDVDSGIEYLPDMYWSNVDYSDQDRVLHPKDKLKMELIINSINNTSDIMDVTTNTAKFYENDVEVINKYSKNDSILLVRLRPGDIFKCRMRSSLGVGKRNNIWSAISNCYYDDYKNTADNDESHKFKFTVESSGQLDEYSVMIRACETVNKRLDNILHIIKNKYYATNIKNTRSVILELENETHTLGNIINDSLQNHPRTKSSGLSKPDHLINSMVIQLETLDDDPLKVFFEAVNHTKKIFDKIKEELKRSKSK